MLTLFSWIYGLFGRELGQNEINRWQRRMINIKRGESRGYDQMNLWSSLVGESKWFSYIVEYQTSIGDEGLWLVKGLKAASITRHHWIGQTLPDSKRKKLICVKEIIETESPSHPLLSTTLRQWVTIDKPIICVNAVSNIKYLSFTE